MNNYYKKKKKKKNIKKKKKKKKGLYSIGIFTFWFLYRSSFNIKEKRRELNN